VDGEKGAAKPPPFLHPDSLNACLSDEVRGGIFRRIRTRLSSRWQKQQSVISRY